MIKGKINYLPKKSDNEKKETKNVKATMIDTHMYQDSIEDVKAVRDKLYKNNQTHEFVEQLTEDLFHCLYKTYPDINHIDDVVEENRLSHEILSDLISGEKFNQLRENTVSNLFNSTLSLSSVQDQAVKTLRAYMKQNSEMKDLMDNISKAKKTREKLEEKEKQTGKQDDKLKQKLDDLINNINKSKEDLQFDLQDLVNDLSDGIASASDMVNEVNDLLGGFGGNADSSVRKMPYDDKVALAKAIQNSGKFKTICDFVGRLTEMVGKVGKKPSPHGHAVSDIGLGNKIPKVLSSEKVKLTDTELEYEFLKKYVNKGLLEFKTDGREDGKGPMVICLDESGSMECRNREEWSKAFCIACIQIAHKQKRNCKIITFSSKVGRIFEFDKKKIDANKILNFSEYFLDGGTDFELPMIEALNSIKDPKYKKADIMFVTDGDPHRNVDKDFVKELDTYKKTKGLSVQAILIGDNVRERHVKVFADSIVRISNVNEDGAIIDVFNNVQR